MAATAATAAVVARLFIGAQEPGQRVVQARLVQVQYRHGDAIAGARATIGLAQIRAPGFLQALDIAAYAGQAGFREQVENVAAAALEDPEHVTGWHGLPGWHRPQRIEYALGAHVAVRRNRIVQPQRLAVAAVGLAQQIALVGQDAIVVSGAAPEHRAGGHQAALGGFDDRQVAGAAGFAGHPVVAGVHEADESRAFAVQQGVAGDGVGAGGVIPGLRIARLHVRTVQQCAVGRAVRVQIAGRGDRGVTTVTIRATQHHRGAAVHGFLIGVDVAALAAVAFLLRLIPALDTRRMRRRAAVDLDRLRVAGGRQGAAGQCRGDQQQSRRQKSHQ